MYSGRRRLRRRWTSANRARRRLLTAAKHGSGDVWGAHVLPLILAIDPQVSQFGGNFGFSDGSVLSRQIKTRKRRDGQWVSGWTWQANDL